MGLTDLGYQRRTFNDILNDKIQKAKELFGEDIDTGDHGPLGKFLRINAYDQALLEEELEKVYYSRFPNTASGYALDRLLVYGGISRNPATEARYSVTIQGKTGHVIDVGYLVGTDTDLTYYATRAATIGDDGTCLLEVSCTQAGSIGNVNASAINKAINPDADITSVTGTECLSAGSDAESDTELRERLKAAIAGTGSSSANAIRAALLRIPTVQYAEVIENDTDTEDDAGRPPHSFECYVLGGADHYQEIAESIFDKRPIGIRTVGDNEITVTDASGNEKQVRFSSALNVNVNVRVQIRTDATYAADGAEKIHASVSDHINGLGIGKNLVLSTLYGYIYQTAGVVEVASLELSTDGGVSYGTANVNVPKYGVCVCSEVNVEVVT